MGIGEPPIVGQGPLGAQAAPLLPGIVNNHDIIADMIKRIRKASLLMRTSPSRLEVGSVEE
jgi:hypothetical protein